MNDLSDRNYLFLHRSHFHSPLLMLNPLEWFSLLLSILFLAFTSTSTHYLVSHLRLPHKPRPARCSHTGKQAGMQFSPSTFLSTLLNNQNIHMKSPRLCLSTLSTKQHLTAVSQAFRLYSSKVRFVSLIWRCTQAASVKCYLISIA